MYTQYFVNFLLLYNIIYISLFNRVVDTYCYGIFYFYIPVLVGYSD